MFKSASKKLIFSLLSLIVSCCLMGGAVFAWFINNRSIGTGGLDFGVVDEDGSSIVISSINGSKPGESFILHPRNTLELVLSVTDDIADFHIVLNETKADYQSFKEYFSARNDLLLGRYYRGVTTVNGNDEVNTDWREFDVDGALASLDADDQLSAKLEFLKLFSLSNSVHSALEVSIVLNEIDYPLTKATDSEFYRNENLTAVSKGAEMTLTVRYGDNNFTPTATVESDSMLPFAAGEYRLHNYNCFLCHKIMLSFGSGTDETEASN